MTKRTATTVAVLIWAITLVPAALLAQWWAGAGWTWQGFLTAYAGVVAICLTFELVQRWVQRRLERRRARSGAAPTPGS
jgi:hypothetical protein